MIEANPNASLIAGLQSRLKDSLASAVPDRGMRYGVLDFPNHSNVGDSAIYVGEDILLQGYFHRQPAIVTEAFDKDIETVSQLAKDLDVLFLHGGGNFGDLWPRHQQFREKVIATFPEKKIVQLPQTLYFKEHTNLERAARIIDAHPDFTLMVRDQVSERVAREAFRCEVNLVPDMAFMIGPVQPKVAADLKIVGLMREDQEGQFADKDALQLLPKPNAVIDWPRETREPKSRIVRFLERVFPPSRPTPSEYQTLAQGRLDKGLAILSRGEVIVTDRLHAHILTLLLGKRHVVLDNSYGKISTFIDAWTKGGLFESASTIEAATDSTKKLIHR